MECIIKEDVETRHLINVTYTLLIHIYIFANLYCPTYCTWQSIVIFEIDDYRFEFQIIIIENMMNGTVFLKNLGSLELSWWW